MRAVIIGVCALALCLAGSLGVLQAAYTPAVTIAVLRGDGVLVPIVTRSGGKWTNTWPVPLKAADVPLGLDGIPKRWWGKPGATTTWHAWQIDGVTSEICGRAADLVPRALPAGRRPEDLADRAAAGAASDRAALPEARPRLDDAARLQAD